MKRSVILFIFGTALLSEVLADSKIDELTKRIEDLERQQALLMSSAEEPRPQVNSFLNNSLTFGGFFEPGYSVIWGEDTDTQAATANILAFNVAADYQSNFRFVGQFFSTLSLTLQNPHNDPRGASATFPEDREFNTTSIVSTLTQGYVEYTHSRGFNVQSGLGYVPVGYAFQQRELFLFWRRGGPQLLRTTQLVLPFWTGVNIHGSFDAGAGTTGYNVYTFSPGRNVKGFGMGTRGWWSSENDSVILGVSGQVAKGEGETYEVGGLDFKFEHSSMVVRGEYVHQFTLGNDPFSAYIEPGIYAFDEKWLFFFFGDYSNNSLNKTTPVLEDPVQKWEYGGGVNFLPTSYTRYRLGLTYNDYVGERDVINGQERDYWSVDISAGVAF